MPQDPVLVKTGFEMQRQMAYFGNLVPIDHQHPERMVANQLVNRIQFLFLKMCWHVHQPVSGKVLFPSGSRCNTFPSKAPSQSRL